MPAGTSVKCWRLGPVRSVRGQEPLGHGFLVGPQTKNLVPRRRKTPFDSQWDFRRVILRCALPEKGGSSEKRNRPHHRVVYQLSRSKQSRLLPPLQDTPPTGNPSSGFSHRRLK